MFVIRCVWTAVSRWRLTMCLAGSLLVLDNQGRADDSRAALQILSKHCYACHGPDESTREGGLALHRQDLSRLAGDSDEPGIVPGKPQASHILARIKADDDSERMPPSEHGPALTAAEIDILEKWIRSGAEYQQHWAYQPLAEITLPELPPDTATLNPIDRLVRDKLQSAGLSPNPPESPDRLMRRLFLDLTGLPPTVSEQQRWLPAMSTAEGRAELVDHLLASPRFGEHWARMWLDLARYADSQGYAQDEIRSIWKYRDWVIEAFNRDLPFDQFTIEQLAGDLLPNATEQQLLATAFHRNTMTNTEGGTNDEEFRHAAIVDRVNTTGTVWLATTVGCAQCHTHKYDPLTHREYYQLFAIFNQTEDHDQPDNRPNLASFSPEQLETRNRLSGEIAQLKQRLAASPEQPEPIQTELTRLETEFNQIQPVQTPIMRDLPSDKLRQTAIAIGGAYSNRGETVEPGIPEVWQTSGPIQCRNRLEFAQWLVSESNPLATRVAVNRIWEQLLGLPLVASMDDFGSQGLLPSNAALLDWLAREFRQQGFSIKKLCRLIVLSATYQQSSRISPPAVSVDPKNELLGRAQRYRLSAEQIRDYALAVSGLLSAKMYGPPVRPPQPKLGLNAAFGGSLDWEPSEGEDRYRRGIYTLLRRTNLYPSFMALDATSRTVCTVQRTKTNTPITAFVTLNDPVFIECAQAIGRQYAAVEAPLPEQAQRCFRQIVCREPSPTENEWLVAFWTEQVAVFRTDAANAALLTGVAATPSDQPVDPQQTERLAQQAAWVVLANALLNLDETLTRN